MQRAQVTKQQQQIAANLVQVAAADPRRQLNADDRQRILSPQGGASEPVKLTAENCTGKSVFDFISAEGKKRLEELRQSSSNNNTKQPPNQLGFNGSLDEASLIKKEQVGGESLSQARACVCFVFVKHIFLTEPVV